MHQSQDREGARTHDPTDVPCPRRPGDRIIAGTHRYRKKLPTNRKAASVGRLFQSSEVRCRLLCRVSDNRTHGQLLSWMRLTTPPSSRQADMPAIDDLSFGYRALG